MPSRAISTILPIAGVVALSGITVLPLATSRMYASPWSLFYWVALACPAILLVWRASTGASFRLPGRGWSFTVVAGVLVIVAAALASPYRETAVRWSVVPLSAAAVFLALFDWLESAPENRARLQAVAIWCSTFLMAVSVGWWLENVFTKFQQGRTAEIFEMRNPHPLGHSNYTAGLALLALPWLVAGTTRPGRTRSVAIAGLALGAVALFTSGSRGGLLGAAVFAFALVVLQGLNRKRAFALAIALVALGSLSLVHPRVRALLRSGDPTEAPNTSNVQRAAMLAAGLHLGAERPVLGWGLHTTPLVYPRVRATLDGGPENVLQLHNLPLEVWSGTGIAGVMVLASGLVLIARDARRFPSAGAGLLAYLVFSLTDYQMDVPVIALGFAALCAAVARPRSAPTSPYSRFGLTGIAVASLAVIIGLGKADRTPSINADALAAAQTPAGRAGAIELLRESLRSNPDQEIAHFNLGWLLLVQDPVAAEKHFRAAAALVPDKGGVFFGLALARLNAGDRASAVRLLALECINDPRFIASYWWNEAAIGALRDDARDEYTRMLAWLRTRFPAPSWRAAQATALETLAARLGAPGPGAERAYRRQRSGYPVLMRDQEIAPPVDVYDVRDTEDFESRAGVPLPPKGWLPGPVLLKLLDESASARQ